jgi:hypothetical protein
MLNDIQRFLPLLGTGISDQPTIEVFSEHGMDVSLEIVPFSGTFRAYIERKTAGVAFSFRNDLREDKTYILDGVFSYAEGKDGYAEYRGALPSGISFRNSRDEILRLMGPAKWHRDRADGSLGAEKWNVGPYFMHITWSGQTNRPAVISFGLQALEP